VPFISVSTVEDSIGVAVCVGGFVNSEGIENPVTVAKNIAMTSKDRVSQRGKPARLVVEDEGIMTS
jgi:isoaspartyl peptidase/L-asparaginase-like protein (Ntn-hydrolase superfamily)